METEREEARKKRSRSLSVLSPDLVGGSDLTLQEWGAHDEHVGRSKGAIMETLISQGNSNRYVGVEFERRFTVSGARGVRVGEAKNPGPGDRDGGATQLDSGAISPFPDVLG